MEGMGWDGMRRKMRKSKQADGQADGMSSECPREAAAVSAYVRMCE